MKIFVIGFNKTGTSSLDFLFKKVGINAAHTTKPVMTIIDKYDAFSDGNHVSSRFNHFKYKTNFEVVNF